LNRNYVKQILGVNGQTIKECWLNLDPYTVYFNEQDVVRFKINNTGEYTGIGAFDSERRQISQRTL
jgi:carboxyl-terminal processing protease